MIDVIGDGGDIRAADCHRGAVGNGDMGVGAARAGKRLSVLQFPIADICRQCNDRSKCPVRSKRLVGVL